MGDQAIASPLYHLKRTHQEHDKHPFPKQNSMWR